MPKPDFTRYADNIFYKHLERFRDEWLERSLRSHVRVRDMHLAYDAFCEQNGIVHRKIVTYELLPELSRIGVRMGRVRIAGTTSQGSRRYDICPAFVTWRLTRNAKYAARSVQRTRYAAFSEHGYTPIGKQYREGD